MLGLCLVILFYKICLIKCKNQALTSSQDLSSTTLSNTLAPFHYLEWKCCPQRRYCPAFSSSAPINHQSAFAPMICLFWVVSVNKITCPVVLGFFTHHPMSKVHPCHSMTVAYVLWLNISWRDMLHLVVHQWTDISASWLLTILSQALCTSLKRFSPLYVCLSMWHICEQVCMTTQQGLGPFCYHTLLHGDKVFPLESRASVFSAMLEIRSPFSPLVLWSLQLGVQVCPVCLAC